MPEHDQTQLAGAVLSHAPFDPDKLPRLTARPGADPYARLNVYRNNTYESLTSVLLAVFPVTARLVDERYFRYAASRFIACFPPEEPRLSQFGAALPRFLSSFGHLASMRFVAETARLEWAIATALDRGVEPPMPLSALNRAERPETLSLILAPSLVLLSSRWPVFSIWTAHQREASPDLAFVNRHAPERVIAWRSGGSIRLARIDQGRMAFLRWLIAGGSLEEAAGKALSRDPMFDLAAAIAQLFGDGLVTGATHPRN